MQATPTFAGIDWSWQHHALCIIDDAGQRIEETTFGHSRPGLAKITAMFRRHGVTRVGIERGERHTGAVLAAQSGATLAELQARLGHTTVAAAMRYQHVAADRDALLAQRLSELA